LEQDYESENDMTREAALPIEFVPLQSRVNFVARRGKSEWSSSCPECGGDMHADGKTFPDRFRMWPVSKGGFPLGWCRNCGYIWTPKEERKPTREEIETWRKAQIEAEEQRKREAERAIELLQSENLWTRFAQNMDEQTREIVKGWGIPESWQDYLKIGYVPNYRVYKGDEHTYQSPAVTMPVWWAQDKIQNIKIRVLKPQDDCDRYRNWYRTGEQYLYMPLHDAVFDGGGVILVEGEKKAAVTEIYNPTDYRVIGYQSKRPDPDLFSLLENCEPIYIMPDPDAFIPEKNGRAVDYLVQNIGRERSRVVRLPVKVDDGIVKYNLNLSQYIKGAIRP